MIVSFKNAGTEDVFNGKRSRKARQTLPETLWNVAHRKLDYLWNAATLDDLSRPPKNRLEPLKGDRAGWHSIRINDQYRIVFRWTEAGPADVEIVDYH